MAYLGLARKWRPQTFQDLVGQGHIAQTVLNAIKSGRISQGYLFTGTRGIGKTSAARIFAKALRCQATTEPGVPCNQCGDCTQIANGNSTDVLEIDGASNNGVDAVREIRESAKYLPSNGKYKIYIIDEVHMLTTAAFNALLKTLEEPPAHVIFVFATTDPQKIPATVLSRCQRFDFKRVSQHDLEGRLKQICEAEKVTITPDALAILAREAEGSMRDGVSLLDQVLSTNNGNITATGITNALGLVDKQIILDCVTGILKRQPLLALEAVGKVHLHGFDLKQFGRELLRYIRQVMVTRLLEDRGQADLSGYIDVSDVDMGDLKSLSKTRSLDDLDMLFRLLNHGLEDVARSSIPKMVMDVLVIKMAASEQLVNLSDANFAAFVPEKKSPQQPIQQPAQPVATKPIISTSAPRTPSKFEVPKKIETKTPEPQQAAPAQSAKPLPTENQRQWWKACVDFVKSQKPLVGSILEHMGFESLNEENGIAVLSLGYVRDHSFYKDQLQSRAYNDLIATLLKNYLGRAVRLEYKEVLSSYSPEKIEEDKKRADVDARKKAILDSEAMRATQQLLGARLEKLVLKEISHDS